MEHEHEIQEQIRSQLRRITNIATDAEDLATDMAATARLINGGISDRAHAVASLMFPLANEALQMQEIIDDRLGAGWVKSLAITLGYKEPDNG